MKKLQINNFEISNKSRPYIVAELSANHNGSLRQAIKHLEIAKQCGVDAIKLQTYTPNSMTINSKKKDFIINSGIWKNYNLYDLYKEAHTPYKWHKEIFDYARKINLTCFSTPFDEKAVDLLEKLNTPAYKIASFELIDTPLIQYISKTKKPIILSTGMASIKEIDIAVNIVSKYNNKQNLILLHCVSSYPTPVNKMNLNRIKYLQNRYKCLVGLSDHSKSNLSSIVSVSLGASLIEKHFIISKSINSPDKKFSILPRQLKKLVDETRLVWQSKGSSKFQKNEIENESKKYRRSIYIIKSIKKNEKLTEKNIKRIRPGYGLDPSLFNKVIGKKVKKNLFRGDPLSLKDLH